MHNQNDGENNCSCCGGGKENVPRWSLKRHRQRSGKKNQPEGYQRELRGHIEWYDRNCIKVNREGTPNLLVYKHAIRYMFKQEEETPAG